MNCSNCGAYVGDKDAFCGECGQPVPPKVQAAPGPSPDEVPDQETELLPGATLPVPDGVQDQETELPSGATLPAPDGVQDQETELPRSATLPAPDGVQDQETELPRSVTLPPPTATTAPAKASATRWAVIAGAVAASVGLCICIAGVALFLIGRAALTPTPGAEAPVAAPLYEESFDTPGGWDVYDDEDTWAEYAEGGYRLGVKSADYVTWGNPEDLPQFADFRVEVDAWQVEGPLDNNLGILVRYQDDGESFYWFQISSDGYYSVDLMQAGEWVTLISWEPSTAIQQGLGAVNRLLVECDGSQFDFGVNGVHLATVSDANFGSGSIGLAAGTFAEPGVVIQFDNLKVTALEE